MRDRLRPLLGGSVVAVSVAWVLGISAVYYLGQHSLRAVVHLLKMGLGDSLLVFQGPPAHLLVLVEALLLLAIVTVLGDWLLDAAGVGLVGAAERIAYGGGIGLALLALLTLLLGLAGLLFAWLFWVFAALGAAAVVFRLLRAGGVALRRDHLPRLDPLNLAFIAMIAYLVYGGFLMATSPDLIQDSLSYHLAGPHLYVSEHRIFNLIPRYGIWRSEVPSNQEMLYTAGLLLRGSDSSLARLLNTGEAVLIVVTMAAAAAWLVGRVRPGLLAAAAFIAAPTVILELGSGLNDLAVTLFTLLTAVALVRWLKGVLDGRRDGRWLVLAGVLGGFTYGFKVTGAPVIPIGAAFVVLALAGPAANIALRGRLLHAARSGAVFAVAATLTATPWFLKSLAFTKNPVYPMLNTVFPSPYWDAHADRTMLAAQFTGFGVGHSPFDVLTSLSNLTFVNSKFDGVIGPIFLCLIPIAPLMAWVNRQWLRERGALATVLALWAFGAALFLAWALTVNEARFAFPALAVLILASGCALSGPPAGWRSRLSTGLALVVLAQAALNTPGFLPWHSDVPAASEVLAWGQTDLGVAFGRETPDQFFVRYPGADFWNPWTVIGFINHHLTGNAVRIYIEGPPVLPYYYLAPDVTQTANHDVLFEPSRRVDLYAPDALSQLKAAGITYLYVNRLAYEKLQATSMAGHLEVLTQTPGPANDYWFTPMRLLRIDDSG